ncbi:TIGR01440 family protein [Brevibacillus laterosporus]|uniref:TIGR01440 family protein n=1 Tax=Brevibacillus laterosporus TaxID=1465 RepID=UPI0035A27C49
MEIARLQQEIKDCVLELVKVAKLQADQLLVIGCSTSEVIGQHIGKSGSEQVASAIWMGIAEAQQEVGFQLAFQCCEHLNRALVVERSTIRQYGLEEVSVIPVPRAGGSMAAYAYQQMKMPAVVEHIKADAGLDIGDTFIGMHLKHVVVPVRLSRKQVGEAHLTAAYTRPKMIGGARAVYERIDQLTCT